MQGQINYADQFTVAGDLIGWQPFIRGMQAGLVGNPDEDDDTTNVVLTDVRALAQRADMIDAEVYAAGQPLYLMEVAGIVTITTEPTDLFFGYADEIKLASQENVKIRIKEPGRDRAEFLLTIDFAKMPALAANGTYVLRNFLAEGGARFVYDGGLSFEHDGLLAPGTATVSLGDGTGGNDQLLAATALSVITALGEPHEPHDQVIASTPAAVSLDQLAITVALGPVTAGRLTIRARLANA